MEKQCACGKGDANWYTSIWFRGGSVRYQAKLCYSPGTGRGKFCYDCAKKDGDARAAKKNAEDRR